MKKLVGKLHVAVCRLPVSLVRWLPLGVALIWALLLLTALIVFGIYPTQQQLAASAAIGLLAGVVARLLAFGMDRSLKAQRDAFTDMTFLSTACALSVFLGVEATGDHRVWVAHYLAGGLVIVSLVGFALTMAAVLYASGSDPEKENERPSARPGS